MAMSSISSPPPHRGTRPFAARRWRTAGRWILALALALAHLGLVAPSPIAGGPRDVLPQRTPSERWTPPSPVVDHRFATFPFIGPAGREGLWVLPTGAVPLRFVAEREVVDRFGADELGAAVEVWNGTVGSRFGATVDLVVDDGVQERRRDGTNRIYLDRRSCGTTYLARANLWPGEVIARDGRIARTIAEVDIGICERMRPEQLDIVITHELAHIAGLDHLCDIGEECHRPGMDEDNSCRIMSSRLDPCQAIEPGDHDGLVHLHPRLPRASGGDGRSTSASVTATAYPVPRTSSEVVLSAYDGPPHLSILAASYAAHLGAPHLLVDDDCTAGPHGRALDRTLAVAGDATLIGELAPGCAAALEGAWAIPTTQLTTADEVTSATADLLPSAGQVVLAPSPLGPDDVALAATSASAATLVSAPLVLVDDADDATGVLERLETFPEVEEVLAVADTSDIGPRVLAAIAGEGIEIRRVEATDGGQAATGLARIAEIADAAELAVTIAAEDRPEHLVPAIVLAGRAGGLLLPIGAELAPAEDRLLRERVTRGAIVGGPQAIGREEQISLSRRVDGDPNP